MRVIVSRVPGLLSAWMLLLQGVLAQETPPPVVDLDSVLAWDHPGTDVHGNPDVIVEAEVAVSSSLDDLNAGAMPLAAASVVSPGPGMIMLADLLHDMENGVYRLWVRVRDRSALWSLWSEPLEVELSLFVPPRSDEFIRADADSSLAVDISDAVFTAVYLFLDGPAPDCPDAADANDDGFMDISDPVYTLFYIFVGGPPPPAPFPDFGIDPTSEDALSCDRQTP